LYLQNQPHGSMLCALKSLNHAENAGPTPETARGYATLAALSGFIPVRSVAEMYFRMALETAEQVRDLPALEWVLLSIGVYDIGMANWDRALSTINRGLGIAERLGDSRRTDDLKQSLASIAFYTGDIAGSLPLLESAQKTAARRGDNRLAGEVLRWRAYALLLLGRYDQLGPSLEELHRLRTLPFLTGEALHLSDVFALRASWQLRRGRDADARAAAHQAALRLANIQDSFHDLLLERFTVADVFLRLWERTASSGGEGVTSDTKWLKATANKTCCALERFSKRFPIGSPYAYLARGYFDLLSGRHERAQQRWRFAMANAQRLRLRMAEGLACYQLGRYASGVSEGRGWLQRARAIFVATGAVYEQAESEDELAR
jgi:tetratricopeptide (TPR) repeat protein